METRGLNARSLVLPVVFALACVTLTLLLYHRFGGTGPLEPKGYRVTVPLTDAANLVKGADVQIAGVDVGHVVQVDRDGNGARAEIEVDAPLRTGARSVVRTKTLLGEAYLEIAPGTGGLVPEGGTLARAEPTVALDEFLDTFAPSARRDMRALLRGMATATHGRGQALNTVIARTAPVAADYADVFDELARRDGDLNRLTAASGDVLTALAEREGALRSAIDAGDAVLRTTAARDRELAATMRELPPFLHQLQATSDRLTAAAPDLEGAVTALGPVAGLVDPALGAVLGVAPEFRGLFAELPATIRAGDRGLPAVEPIADAARTGLRAFYPAARELVPTLQLLAANRNSLIFFFANVAQVMNGTFVGPGGLLRNYGVGIITVWNETLAGWKHKLSTNRQNPYPKPPDGLLDTGRLGYLKAYDCRHADNPLLFPPTGTGAPPCVEQGPWTFNGKSAYYPRLTLAPP